MKCKSIRVLARNVNENFQDRTTDVTISMPAFFKPKSWREDIVFTELELWLWKIIDSTIFLNNTIDKDTLRGDCFDTSWINNAFDKYVHAGLLEKFVIAENRSRPVKYKRRWYELVGKIKWEDYQQIRTFYRRGRCMLLFCEGVTLCDEPAIAKEEKSKL